MTIQARLGPEQDGEAPSIPGAALAGLVATVGMDLGALGIFARLFGTRGLGPPNLGRWIGHMREGRFTHDDIAAARPIAHEAAIGVCAHYAIGLTLGAGYGLLLRARQPPHSSLLLATAYGLATTAFAWFWLFPACGLGAMGLRHDDVRLPAFALCNHAVFGLGLGTASRLVVARLAERRGPSLALT